MTATISPLHSFSNIRDSLKLFKMTCPILLIVAQQSPPLVSDNHPLLEDIEKWGNAKIISLDAGHDVHITHREIVASFITEFLMKTEGKL